MVVLGGLTDILIKTLPKISILLYLFGMVPLNQKLYGSLPQNLVFLCTDVAYEKAEILKNCA